MKLLWHLLILVFLLLPSAGTAQDIKEGTIYGAKFMIAVSPGWNGKCLMIAHGYVPEINSLNANFSPEKEFFQELLREGWLIASSSYRRNGMVVEDGIEDLNNLYDYLENNYGKPKLTLLQGSSMGGFIGTVIAENPGRDYHGVLNMGAALQLNDRLEAIHLNHHPKIPILFLSNQTEFQPPEQYALQAKGATVGVWKISRDGHVNINQEEQARALKALEQMVAGQPIPTWKDGTIVQYPNSTALFKNAGAYFRVAWSDPVYGNLYSTLIPDDLKKIAIRPGKWFNLVYNNQKFPVLYGTSYNSVPAGSWVMFTSGEGTMQISCNYCNAYKTLGFQNGDSLFVERPK